MTQAQHWQEDEVQPRVRRPVLAGAALLLAATAAFHLTGLEMAAGWLDGGPGRLVTLLWIAPALGWFVIAGFWAYHAAMGIVPGWPALIMSALIPACVGVPLLASISLSHPGGYLLLGSGLLALASRKGRG